MLPPESIQLALATQYEYPTTESAIRNAMADLIDEGFIGEYDGSDHYYLTDAGEAFLGEDLIWEIIKRFTT